MMKILLWMLLLLFSTSVFALIGEAETEIFTIDTVDPTLTLIAPNGGEAWYIGDTNDVLWQAEDTNLETTPITIWYRMSIGSDFILLAEDYVNSGSYPWEMPTSQSYNAQVKIQAIDSFGNFSEKVSQNPFSITYVPPEAPEGVIVDPSDGNNAVISWQPVTETIYGTPIEPDGYIILYNETPYEDDQFYYYLADVTEGTTHTHYGVVRHRDQMYYRVVAYKDYDGRITEALVQLRQRSDERVLWGEALKGSIRTGGGR
jgi:hypothetical protein